MTTPKPLPADIEDALREYGEASEDFGYSGDEDYEAEDAREAAREKFTALLSGYVEDAQRWREMGATRYPPPPRTFGGSND